MTSYHRHIGVSGGLVNSFVGENGFVSADILRVGKFENPFAFAPRRAATLAGAASQWQPRGGRAATADA